MTSNVAATIAARVDIPEDEKAFLRDLIKMSRQKHQHVKWIDRDGTERVTTLTSAESARLTQLAQTARLSKAELLRQAAHIPVAK